MVLLFNSRLKLFLGKLKSKWSGPFQIKEVKHYRAIVLEDPVLKENWIVNGQWLKIYLDGEIDRLTTTIPLGDSWSHHRTVEIIDVKQEIAWRQPNFVSFFSF